MRKNMLPNFFHTQHLTITPKTYSGNLQGNTRKV